jgi:3-methyladenine DNA glycosylase AlkD
MHAYIKPLRAAFEEVADSNIAAGQSAYMKNLFPFFGIKAGQRREITNYHFKTSGHLDVDSLYEIVRELWALPQREYQHTALELIYFHRKLFRVDTIECIEYCISNKSWWDTVDALNTLGAGIYFEKFPAQIKKITGRWNRAEHMWLNRSSLLFQLKYKSKTDKELLSSYITHLSSSKEFFIRKAIGWVLREYAKTDPEWVIKFVAANSLSPLSKREALKHLG